MAVSRPAVFLDKDGTLVVDVPYNADPDLVELAAGAGRAVRELHAAGFLVVVVSNQSGLARGMFTTRELAQATARVDQLLAAEGGSLDGWYWCAHHPDGVVEDLAVACACRKPRPGMLLSAAKELDIDLARSWMVGDILHDVEAGNRAGCRTVLLDVGNETGWIGGPLRTPDATVVSLDAAVDHILAATGCTPAASPVRTGGTA